MLVVITLPPSMVALLPSSPSSPCCPLCLSLHTKFLVLKTRLDLKCHVFIEAEKSHPFRNRPTPSRATRLPQLEQRVDVVGLDFMQDAPISFARYASLLKRYGETRCLLQVQLLHDHIARYGYDLHVFVGNCLVQTYGQCGQLEDAQAAFDNIGSPNLYSWSILMSAYSQNGRLDEARSVFRRMPEPNVVCWSGFIAACAQNGCDKEALELFWQMQVEGILPDEVTFISALDACSNTAALHDGHEIHAGIVNGGFESDLVVGNALVNMYGKCRSLSHAQIMFCKMPQLDVVSWNAMISACTQNGNDKCALELFCQMQHGGISPNRVTFICVLNASANLAALEEGQHIHFSIIDHGLNLDVVVGNALINMYGKCGSLNDAEITFGGMCSCNVVTYTTMITVFAQNGYGAEALQLFDQMQQDGIMPTNVTFVSLLDACSSLENFLEGQKMHTHIVDTGFESDVVVGNALMNMYGKCGSLDGAKTVFCKMCLPDLVSWSSIITACTDNGDGHEAMDLFQQMQLEGIRPDRITFICVLDACASLIALVEGQMVHARIIDAGLESDAVVASALVNMYGKCGSPGNASIAFSKVGKQNIISWNTMITACNMNGLVNKALEFFNEMCLGDVMPDNITFICAIYACASLATLRYGREIHACVLESGLESDVVVGNALVNMYGKCGCLNDARCVFDGITQRDVVTWNTMVTVCAQNGHDMEALELYQEMQSQGFKPDEITFISVLTSCSHTGQVADGRKYFMSMSRDYDLTQMVEHYGCIIDLLGRAGQLNEAETLIKKMPIEHVNSSSLSLLGACRIHSDAQRGLRVASRILESGKQIAVPYVLLSNIHAAEGRCEDVANAKGVK